MDIEPRADEILTKIGFTQLESEVYLYLLTEGAHTGYAVAKAIGKAIANVYKALERLAQKGAVEQSSGKSKLCVALPWRQLIASETKKFNTNTTVTRQTFLGSTEVVCLTTFNSLLITMQTMLTNLSRH